MKTFKKFLVVAEMALLAALRSMPFCPEAIF
jgi:hypothetical protein